ncbi:MAG TPA: NAD+ synthase [Candidatus Bathyarchaeia archaeon]|nr:NAD+ synthase [Candidatus Bathyarchaeia archaeon]
MNSRIGPNVLSIDEPGEIVERMARFLKTHAERIGAKCLVVGLSGGLDSSVAAALCSTAVGGSHTIGVWIQEEESFNQSSLRDALDVAKKFGIRIKKLDMTPLTHSIASIVQPDRERLVPWGNVKARLRAMILYYFANSNNGLVVGTGDKSEIMLGYFTKYGDGACDLQPLADLYKTSLREVARYLKLPNRISSKPSSPELWPGQTAERELGLPYEKLDLILWGLERWMAPEDISEELSIPLSNVKEIRTRWILSEHKRRPPLAMKLGFRTAGQDLRIPYNA